MDIVELIISDPHHKHVEEDQAYLRNIFLNLVMKEYSIREKFQTRSKRSSKKTYMLFCKSRKCEFLMRASGTGETGMFRIREFRPQHTCPVKDKIYLKVHATSMLIGGIVKQKFKNHKRKYSATEIRNDMKEDFGMDLTCTLCWRAKERALEELRGKPSASYGKLPSYLYVLNTTYLEAHIRMKKTDENEFLYVFIALNAFIKGFDHYRPIVVVDASHLRGMYTGEFVTACTMVEQNLKKAYGERQNMCVVSDRNSSIIKAVSDVYNDIAHYACMWHLWGNVKKLYRKSHDALSEIFYVMAKSYSKSDFQILMEKVEIVDIRVKNYLELVGYEKWARSYATVNRG
ncbi:uncharacterized protein LOC107846596 [Capsicum annuum]|uniref:uncharacterized protein LOC107846596 n=1 Tax=Capsicum annuum TaxID=4072 RepID=UPI001FB1330C|nr:uncharacterized protein LOC107846596 [Capsicum annuum]